MKEATQIDSFELISDDGHDVVFSIADKKTTRDIYPRYFDDKFTINGVIYKFSWFSRSEIPGKCLYGGKRFYPELKLVQK